MYSINWRVHWLALTASALALLGCALCIQQELSKSWTILVLGPLPALLYGGTLLASLSPRAKFTKGLLFLIGSGALGMVAAWLPIYGMIVVVPIWEEVHEPVGEWILPVIVGIGGALGAASYLGFLRVAFFDAIRARRSLFPTATCGVACGVAASVLFYSPDIVILEIVVWWVTFSMGLRIILGEGSRRSSEPVDS